MAINTYLSVESKNQIKQTRRTETNTWIPRAFSGLPHGIGVGGMGEEMRELSSTNR